MNTIKKLIAVITAVVSTLTVSAGTLSTADFAPAGVRNVSRQCRATLQTLNNAQVLDFLTTVTSQVDDCDADLLAYLLAYYQGIDVPVDPGSIPDMQCFIDIINEFSEYL
ncbi:MAG: hypothetical protein ACI391_07545, partial [Muribaculaceae bacterium]